MIGVHQHVFRSADLHHMSFLFPHEKPVQLLCLPASVVEEGGGHVLLMERDQVRQVVESRQRAKNAARSVEVRRPPLPTDPVIEIRAGARACVPIPPHDHEVVTFRLAYRRFQATLERLAQRQGLAVIRPVGIDEVRSLQAGAS